MRKRLHRKDIKQNKIIISLLAFSVLFLSVGYAAFSTNITLRAKGNMYNKGELCYTTSDNGDGTVTITDYDKTCGSEVNIPTKIKGKTVTMIADGGWDFDYIISDIGAYGPFTNKNITSVYMPDTITYIGDRAFEYNEITELKLSNNLEKMGFEVFAGNKLTSVELPQTLKSIGLGSFSRNQLTSVYIPSSVTDLGPGVFASNNLSGTDAIIYGRNSDGSIDYTNFNSFAGKNVNNLVIPDTITYLSERAFDNVWGDSLTIPSNVKTIGYACFTNSIISTIILSEGVETVKNSAFWQCNIRDVYIPSSIKYFGQNVFSSTPLLSTININMKEGSIDGVPWGATTATINWTGV